jgi:hypothetical protein
VPLSLEDILALPTNIDPERLQRMGLLAPPQPTPSILPAATGPVAKMSPVTAPAPETPAALSAETEKAPALSPLAPQVDPNAVKPMNPPNLLNSPQSSLMGYQSRETARRAGEDLNAPAGAGPTLPATESGRDQVELDRLRDEQRHPWGTPENHPGTLGKIGHVLSRIGNIAGDVVAPATMAIIPGTDLNRRVEERGLENRVASTGKEEAAESEAKAREASEEPLRAAQADEASARAESLRNPPEKEEKVAFHYTDKDGVETAVYEDGTTKKFSEVQQKETAEKMPGLSADELAMFPPPDRAKFKSDEEFAAARADWGKKVNAFKQKQKLDLGVAQRAPLQREYSVLDTKNGNQPAYVTPEMLAADPGRYMPAGPAATALNKTGLIEDIRGTLNTARDAAGRMGNEGFDKKQRAWIAAGLAAPAGQAGQYVESLAREPLTDAQQDYIIALFQMKENAMAMRSVLGAGQGSEELRQAIMQTLPGAGTPSKEFFTKQVNAIENTINRLERGVPNVPLGPAKPKVGGGEEAKPPEGKTTVYDPKGVPHFVNSHQVDDFLKDPKYKGWSKNAPNAGTNTGR